MGLKQYSQLVQHITGSVVYSTYVEATAYLNMHSPQTVRCPKGDKELALEDLR